MSEQQLVHRLQEQLTEAHMRLGESTKQIQSLQEEAVRARAISAEMRFVQQERDQVRAEKGHAQKAVKAAQAKQAEAEREAARTRNELERERKLLAAVRADASRLIELNARIASAQHVGDLFAGQE
jgi:uncharacterized coiled-coil DUF342 family protein